MSADREQDADGGSQRDLAEREASVGMRERVANEREIAWETEADRRVLDQTTRGQDQSLREAAARSREQAEVDRQVAATDRDIATTP